MEKFKYKNNTYSFDGEKFRIHAGENGLYISEIKDKKMIGILTEVMKG